MGPISVSYQVLLAEFIIAVIVLMPGTLLGAIFRDTVPFTFVNVAVRKEGFVRKHSKTLRIASYVISSCLTIVCLALTIEFSLDYGQKQLSDWIGGLVISIVADVCFLPLVKALLSTTWYKLGEYLNKNWASDDTENRSEFNS